MEGKKKNVVLTPDRRTRRSGMQAKHARVSSFFFSIVRRQFDYMPPRVVKSLISSLGVYFNYVQALRYLRKKIKILGGAL